MVIKLGRFGKFLACSGFPECRNTRPLLPRIGVRLPDLPARARWSSGAPRRGATFFGCERYPACDFVAWNKPVPTPCPRCGSPYMVEAGRRGQVRCPVCQQEGRDLAKAG